jgi:hypothetical protein
MPVPGMWLIRLSLKLSRGWIQTSNNYRKTDVGTSTGLDGHAQWHPAVEVLSDIPQIDRVPTAHAVS